MSDVALDGKGVLQMERLATAFKGTKIDLLQTSPRRRARQSAAIVSAQLRLAAEIAEAADEMDFGDWAGRSFDALEADKDWIFWNEARSRARPPRGERMQDAERRLSQHLAGLACHRPMQAVMIVSHAEPIRAVLLKILGIPFDRFPEVDVAPASVSTIRMDGPHVEVVQINERIAA